MRFCFHINQRLSAYCDGELSAGERRRVEEHLSSCARCRARYGRMLERIRLMQRLPMLDPVNQLWFSIEERLSLAYAHRSYIPISFGRWLAFGKRLILRPVAVVAALVIIVTALSLARLYGSFSVSPKEELNLGAYLDLVSAVASADSSPREFPPAAGFTVVDWPEERAQIEFPVISPESLPGGYRLTAVRLYSCGDLRALQFKYRSEQGGLCVFQLRADSKLSLGDQRPEKCTAGGAQCQYWRSNSCSAFSFTLGKTLCVLVTGQADPAVVGALIQALTAEYEKTQHSRS